MADTDAQLAQELRDIADHLQVILNYVDSPEKLRLAAQRLEGEISEELLEAAQKMLNEIEGAISAFPKGMAEAIGNTNFNCIQGRAVALRAAIAKAAREA